MAKKGIKKVGKSTSTPTSKSAGRSTSKSTIKSTGRSTSKSTIKGTGKSTKRITKKTATKPVPLSGAIAVIVGVIVGVGIIVGGGFYAASRVYAPAMAVAEAALPLPSPPLPPPSAPVADPLVDSGAEPLVEPDAELGADPVVGPVADPVVGPVYTEPAPIHFPLPHTYTTITISAAGDTTLGGDTRWAGYHRFMREFYLSGGDHSIFLQNVADIFYASDLSILNLEGTLTYATEHMDKPFVFRGPPHFARILSAGNVDVVTIANNHTIDFHDIGYRDTIRALEAEGIYYFGNEFNTILEVNGINVGLFGFRIWNPYGYNRNRIVAAIQDLRERGAQLIIAYHHWGYENVNMPNDVQRAMGRFTVEAGADLVLGAHPHVLQGIEIYQDVYIVYSLANFSFGGNSNPVDRDTIIFQKTFTFRDGVLVDGEANIIPALVSSVQEYNNFQPIAATGADYQRISRRLDTYSGWLR